MFITPNLIYDTKFGEFMLEVESKYGFDDFTNLIIYLIEEMHNPDSKWRPYLDIIPRNPVSICHNYWNISRAVEPEILQLPIASISLLTHRENRRL